MGGNFKFQLHDSFFWNILFGIFGDLKKRITLSEKKPPLAISIFGQNQQKERKLLELV